MAAVFLGVAAHGVAAPLNPNYASDEFGFYLQDLNARLLIVMAGDDTPEHAAAGAFKFLDAGRGRRTVERPR